MGYITIENALLGYFSLLAIGGFIYVLVTPSKKG